MVEIRLPSFCLDGKIALVTGSTKGIGHGLALGLAQAGADLVIVSRIQSDCDRVAREIAALGRQTMGVGADITRTEQINTLVQRAVSRYGRIDILVNNAGTAITKKAEDFTETEYDKVVQLNQRAVFFMSQAVGRQMIQQGGGRIINVASIFGLVGTSRITPYCIAKGGVVQMTKALALEWAKHNIQVNALSPGYVLTPMNQADLQDERTYNHILKSTPMGRLGQIEDMMGAAVFLASEAARFMTGQCLVIDGGWTIQ